MTNVVHGFIIAVLESNLCLKGFFVVFVNEFGPFFVLSWLEYNVWF